MVTFPNCKINLGLNATEKRGDGYHNLETVFYPIPLKDALEIIRAEETTFNSTGLPINGDKENNLCLKAYKLLKDEYQLPDISIHLHKVIPMGAGLGGGSADGAFMLKMLNKKFKLSLTQEQLITYALQLGSDCPFFIINKPCFAIGRGEHLTPAELDLSAYKIVLINPGIHVSTKEAFSLLTPRKREKSVKEIIQQPIETWREELTNDFETSVFKIHPAIAEIKDTLYDAGATYAAMSGSGSTVFGLYKQQQEVNLHFPDNYLQYTLNLA